MGEKNNIKVVILAGGFGTRISEESHLRPKPMIEIGEKPILWHIMKEYSYYGFHDFIICAGYKQHIIKEWFANYYLHNSDLTFDFCQGGAMQVHANVAEPWKVTIVDTGLNTMTGGRIKRIQPYVGNQTFMLTYGDGVSDVNMQKLLEYHRSHGKAATLTAIRVDQRFGVLDIDEKTHSVSSFKEKVADEKSKINGGYMVLEPKVFDYLQDDTTVFEKEPLSRLAQDDELRAYEHDGYWQCMDTQREKEMLDRLVASGQAPWMKWESYENA